MSRQSQAYQGYDANRHANRIHPQWQNDGPNVWRSHRPGAFFYHPYETESGPRRFRPPDSFNPSWTTENIKNHRPNGHHPVENHHHNDPRHYPASSSNACPPHPVPTSWAQVALSVDSTTFSGACGGLSISSIFRPNSWSHHRQETAPNSRLDFPNCPRVGHNQQARLDQQARLHPRERTKTNDIFATCARSFYKMASKRKQTATKYGLTVVITSTNTDASALSMSV